MSPNEARNAETQKLLPLNIIPIGPETAPCPHSLSLPHSATVEKLDHGDTFSSEGGAIAIEVANSRGLSALQAGAQGFNDAPDPHDGGAADDTLSGQENEFEEAEQPPRYMEATLGRTGGKTREESNDMQKWAGRAKTGAEAAARLISAGGKAGDLDGHPMQRARNAILEGIAWSLAGRGNIDGVGHGMSRKGSEFV